MTLFTSARKHTPAVFFKYTSATEHTPTVFLKYTSATKHTPMVSDTNYKCIRVGYSSKWLKTSLL